MKTILIFMEQKNGKIHPISLELLAKAEELNPNKDYSLEGIVLGEKTLDLNEVSAYGFNKIHHIVGEDFNKPDEIIYKEEILKIIKHIDVHIFLIGATSFGRSLGPRLAAVLQTGLTADCTELKTDGENLIQIRPAFSGNILAHIKCDKFPQMATVRYKEFNPAPKRLDVKTEILKYEAEERKSILEYRELENNQIDITDYDVIVAGGQGLKKAEDLSMLRQLAELLGGQIAASRAIVDQGYISKDYQVGYSGHRVKPSLYIACGISGAPQHLAGMKESGKILAINSDPTAPIFELADYGIVGDLYKIVPMLIEKFKN